MRIARDAVLQLPERGFSLIAVAVWDTGAGGKLPCQSSLKNVRTPVAATTAGAISRGRHREAENDLATSAENRSAPIERTERSGYRDTVGDVELRHLTAFVTVAD